MLRSSILVAAGLLCAAGFSNAARADVIVPYGYAPYAPPAVAYVPVYPTVVPAPVPVYGPPPCYGHRRRHHHHHHHAGFQFRTRNFSFGLFH